MKRNRIISHALAALLSYAPIILFFKSISTTILNVTTKVDTYIYYFIFFILLFMALFTIFSRKFQPDSLFLVAFFALSFVLSALFVSGSHTYMFSTFVDILGNPTYVFFIFSLSAYILAREIKDVMLFLKIFEYYAYATVFGSIIMYFLLESNGYVAQYMVISYNMTLHTTFLIINAFYNRKIIKLVVGLFGLLFIVLVGARGPLVAILISVLFYLLKSTKSSGLRIITGFLTVFLVALLLVFYQTFFEALNNFGRSIGIESRTIQRILSDGFLDDNGRIDIFRKLLGHINVFGNGLYSDRVLLGGIYAHNLFLELLIDYGIFFGIPIISLISLTIIKAIIISKKHHYLVLIILLSTGFTKLMLSGSYLNQEPSLFALLGFSVSTIVGGYLKNEHSMVG